MDKLILDLQLGIQVENSSGSSEEGFGSRSLVVHIEEKVLCWSVYGIRCGRQETED